MFEQSRGNWIADNGDGTFKNPILFADYADPDVIRVGDEFFMVCSSFTYFPGLPILYSKDLVNWKIINYAVKKMPYDIYNTPQHGKGIWAPSIRYYNGEFYIYFSTPDEGVFMTKTKNPFKQWDDVVLVKEAKGIIDPCPFWDEDGQAYLVHAFARSRCGINSMLYLNRMSSDGTKLIGDGVRIFDGRIQHPTVEGPKFYKRNGFYYILAPAGGVQQGWQVALRSKNIFGPYEAKVVLHQGNTEINGPHQGGLVELESGESWFIHFQDMKAYGRITHLQKVQWVDDWPLMGEDINNDGIGEPLNKYIKPKVYEDFELCTPETSDDFINNQIGIQWQWQAHGDESFYSLENGRLRLNAVKVKSQDKPICDAPNVLSQLVQSPEFEVTTKIKLRLKQDGDMAGIAITGGNYYCIRAEKCGDELLIKQTNYEYDNTDMSEEKVIYSSKLRNDDDIYFKIIMRFDGKMSFCFGYNADDIYKVGISSEYNVSRKSWVGARVGIFCLNAKNKRSDGYAKFEYVRFK